jgi:hypothetical protein
MSQESTMQTEVKEVDVNLDEIFGSAPGAESILLPETEVKPSIFSSPKTDLTFLDPQSKTQKKEEKNEESTITTEEEVTELLESTLNQLENETGKGRPKVDKSGLVETFTKLIDDGLIMPFDDDKDLSDYSVKDWKELIEANFTEREKKIKEETPREFFQALPQELQIAAKYVSDGGQDLKGLFKALAQVEEVRELDVDDEHDQETIVRQYLRATRFGSEDEIDEEIDSWKDMDKLGEKAGKFKPKLDKMQEQIIAQQLAEQEYRKEQQRVAAETYMENVYETLKPGELNGIKIDRKTQSQLYSGLVQPSYPSISGKPTNLLGHLLEKYQFIEPKHDLIAEVLWLLSDPDSYKNEIRKHAKTEATQETVRNLKTEQTKSKSSFSSVEDKEDRKAPKISRNINNYKQLN